MFWKKKYKKQPSREVYENLLKKIMEIDKNMTLWNKRMTFVADLLDDPMQKRGEPISCCEYWGSFGFKKVDWCPTCGSYL